MLFPRVRLFALALALSAAVWLTGCGVQVGEPPSEEPFAGVTTAGPETAASIPELQFVDPASISTEQAPTQGGRLEPGSFQSFMTGERITSVQWAEDTESGNPMLLLRLDGAGTKVFADWTADHHGEDVLFVLDNKVVAAPTIWEQITDGMISLTLEPERRRPLEEAVVAGE